MQLNRRSRVLVLASALGTVLAGLAVGTASPSSAATALTSTVVSSAPSPGGAAGTTSVLQLPFGGVIRSYRLFVPSVLPDGPRPMLMGIHGANATPADYEFSTNLDLNAGRHGLLIAYPEGLERGWNAGTCCRTSSATGVDDVGFLAAVMDDVAARFVIDRYRIAMVGGSNGGMMAYRFACERSDLVDVINVMNSTNVAPTCAFTRPVSLLQVAGLADPMVPFEGTATSPFTSSGFPPVLDGVDLVAGLDGCSGTTSNYYNGRQDVVVRTSSGCLAGASVVLYTSATLGHTWSAGPVSAATYGLDMLQLIYGFETGAWAGRPNPAPLQPRAGFAGLASTTVSSVAAPHGAAGTTSVVWLPMGGTNRSYRLFVPATAQPGPRAMLIALHGEGSTAATFEDLSNLDQTAAKNGFAVAYPDGTNGNWNAGACCGRPDTSVVDDLGFLNAVVGDIASRITLDRNRVAVTGFSSGGMMAYSFVCQRSDLVQVVSVVAGALVAPSCSPVHSVSVLHIHGLADLTVPNAGSTTSTLNSNGFPAASVGPVTLALADGCTSSSKGIFNGRTDVSLWQATGCPPGVSVQLIRPAKLPHLWTSTSTEATTYGVNASSLTWSFVAGAWATQPAPVAL